MVRLVPRRKRLTRLVDVETLVDLFGNVSVSVPFDMILWSLSSKSLLLLRNVCGGSWLFSFKEQRDQLWVQGRIGSATRRPRVVGRGQPGV